MDSAIITGVVGVAGIAAGAFTSARSISLNRRLARDQRLADKQHALYEELMKFTVIEDIEHRTAQDVETAALFRKEVGMIGLRTFVELEARALAFAPEPVAKAFHRWWYETRTDPSKKQEAASELRGTVRRELHGTKKLSSWRRKLRALTGRSSDLG